MRTHRTLLRPTLRQAFVLLLVSAGAMPVPAAPLDETGFGLRPQENSTWPRWQGRLGMAAGSAGTLAGGRADSGLALSVDAEQAPLSNLSLFGDYYFLQQGLAPSSRYGGGFRATGGIILGARGAGWSNLPDSLSTLGSGFSVQRRSFNLVSPQTPGDTADGSAPYVGIGYTGLSSLRATGGGWGFSADVGMMALQPRSAVRLGQPGLSDTVRDLQWSPLLQLGVSYSF